MSSRRTESWDQLKIVGMVVGSDAPTENLRVEEKAHAPLRGASLSRIFIASELEEFPTAIDCTSLALVKAARSNPASLRGAARTLLAENQNCGVEPRGYHEDTCSAVPFAQNEFSSTLAMPAASVAIANQTQEEVEQSNPYTNSLK
ncbi:hypothetical protein FD723_35480 (plasmid) [Nostoc sp. C052]|uniref:hypothetical protein n=1 Tax=Nostoc sp. C052 TaxID=2576902 RepID=UPI0015C2FD53|nr:hypothetical protein [Nostoc sp. C052]QLE45577.1 hypothetical protein FD723_35480 [Nostoc sp. C052]